MAPRRPRLKEVADLAGTSIATASRAINDSGYVSDETRARVLEAARQLNYMTNLKARGLRKQRSQSLGLIVPNLINPYYTQLVDTASRLCADHDYYLLLATSRDDAELEAKALTDVVAQIVEGLLWVPAHPGPEQIEYLRAQGIPVVAIGRRVDGDVIDTVVFEDFGGTRAAAQHLIDLGHQRIGYLGGDIRHSSNRRRWEGFQAALEKAGLDIDDSRVKLGSTRTTWGYMACTEMLSNANPPTALCVGSNALMPGVIGALRDGDVSVPEGISFICYDDVEWFSYAIPPITAVKVDQERLAEAAIDLLLSRMDDSQDEAAEPVLVTIDFELVLRNSTAPLARRAG